MKKDPVQTQQQAIDMLLENGVSISIPRRGLMRYILSDRDFIIKPLTLAALYRISKEISDVEFDHKSLADQDRFAPFDVVLANAHSISRVIAVAVEPRVGERRIASLSKYFYNNLHPSKLLEIVMVILKLSSIADFTSSIALIKTIRVTQPKGSVVIE